MTNNSSLFDIRKWFVAPGYVLFFLLLAFPMVMEVLYVKAVLFGIALILTGIAALTRAKLALHHSVVLWTLFLAAVSYFFVLRGFFLGTPGAAEAAQLYVLWPLIYLVLVAGASRPRILLGLRRILVVATIFIGLQGGVYLLTNLGVVPWDRFANLLSLGWQEQSFGLREGYIGMQFPGLNSLPFLVPFAIAALATCARARTHKRFQQVWLWLACFLGLFMALTSARRALIVVTVLAPLLTWCFLRFQPESEKHLARRSLARVSLVLALSVVVFIGALGLVYQFNVYDLFDRVTQGFNFGPTPFDSGANVRRIQYLALIHGWYQHPLVGAGHGASAYDVIRSGTMPWAYELSYVALLFQTGLLGFLAYTAGVVWIYRMGIRVIRTGGELGASILPIMVGMTGFLIANATNPYLARFDGIWVIFLPLAFINRWLLTENQTRTSILRNTRPVPG